jgi:purine catabolism regulator
MAITVGQLLRIPHLQMSLRGGAAGLDHEISWVHTSDLPNPWEWQSTGELLLTNSNGLAAGDVAQGAFIEELAKAGTSAFGVGLGMPRGSELTATLTARADELSLPVLSIPYHVPFTAVVRAVADANAREESHQVARVARLYELVRASVAAGRRGPEQLRELGRELGVRLYLVDPETGLSLFCGTDAEEPAFAEELVNCFTAHGGALPGVLRLYRAGRDGRETVALAVAVQGDQPAALVAEPISHRLPGLALLQHVATVGAMELAQLEADRERARRLGADLLAQLLDRSLDPRIAERQLTEIGVDLSGAVLALSRAGADTIDRIHRRLARLRIPHLLVHRDEMLHLVLADLPENLDHLAHGLGPSPMVGLSNRVGDTARLAEAAHEARWALDAAVAEGRSTVRFGDETALLPRTPAEAQAMVTSVLGPLIAHDAEHGTGYLRTLRTMLRHNRSWRLAAADLHIHKQTLGYRVRRIEQLTGRGLTRTDHIAELWFAVRAHDRLAPERPDH